MKIAVIGSGISGLGAASLLSQKHDVHLFEADARLGGHAHTVSVNEGERSIPMDTGFLVYNELTYPHLTKFFAHFQVPTVDSEMSLSVQVKEKNLEWSGTNLNSVFSQRRNLLRPSFYRMLQEILRFHREAQENCALSLREELTMGELLAKRKFSATFCQDYLLPIGAAIWSTPEKKMLEFPASTFLTFFINHKLLQVNDRPIWRTVKGGSIEYVKRVAAKLSHIHLSTPIQEVERRNGQVYVRTGQSEAVFDRVVLATHAPTTLKMLTDANESERTILGAFRYEPNKSVLHRDRGVMPKSKRCWSSWNVVGTQGLENERKVALSYFLNRLQPLATEQEYFVTLNPSHNFSDEIRTIEVEHPRFDQGAIAAQQKIPSLQGRDGVYFAGAWQRYGFHEDGLLSAVNVAAAMEIPTPWKI